MSEEPNDEANDAGELVERGDAIEARRRKALSDYGIDPTGWPLSILRDEPTEVEVVPVNDPISPLSDSAWLLIADVFPKPHPNQKLGWRETLDALLLLTQTGAAWIKLGKHSEAIRARLHRSRLEQWDNVAERINGAAIDVAERERVTTLCAFAKRYIAERDTRKNTAPTPTAVQRLASN